MLAYHTYYGPNSKQDTMFLLENMYLTQGENGGYSHQGTLAMDFMGVDNNGIRVYNCPYYAPCDLELVATPDWSNHIYVYTSLVDVNFVDGTIGRFTIQVNHDPNTYSIGRRVNQGDILGYTGTYGTYVSGDHVHVEAKRGYWEGLYRNSQGVWCMLNADHLYNLMGVNDTGLFETGGYNWRTYSGVTPGPTPTVQSKPPTRGFPWPIYARKLRGQR